MNIPAKISTRFADAVIRFAIAFIILAIPAGLLSADLFDSWGISKEVVLKKYVYSGEKINEFTPIKNPDYENKIMNMVKIILRNVDPDADKEILVISTKTNPQKDFLLFKNKLFSVMESYNSISKEDLAKVVKKLSEQYGDSNYNPSNEMEIYFISSKFTKIIVHYYTKSKKCEIYFYDSLLYRKLSSNEF